MPASQLSKQQIDTDKGGTLDMDELKETGMFSEKEFEEIMEKSARVRRSMSVLILCENEFS